MRIRLTRVGAVSEEFLDGRRLVRVGRNPSDFPTESPELPEGVVLVVPWIIRHHGIRLHLLAAAFTSLFLACCFVLLRFLRCLFILRLRFFRRTVVSCGLYRKWSDTNKLTFKNLIVSIAMEFNKVSSEHYMIYKNKMQCEKNNVLLHYRSIVFFFLQFQRE